MTRPEKSNVNIEVVLLKKEEFQLLLPNRFDVLSEGEEDVEENTLIRPFHPDCVT